MVATICRSNTSPPVTGWRCSSSIHPTTARAGVGSTCRPGNASMAEIMRNADVGEEATATRRGLVIREKDSQSICDVTYSASEQSLAASSKAREAACCGASALTAYAKMFASSIPGSTSIVVDVSAVESTHGSEMQDGRGGV